MLILIDVYKISEEDQESVSQSVNEPNSDVSDGIGDAISQVDDLLLEAMEETETKEDESDIEGSDITETESDITVIDLSDDDVSDDEAAPTMFLVQSVVETVPYVGRTEDDLESNASFEVIDEQSDTVKDLQDDKGMTVASRNVPVPYLFGYRTGFLLSRMPTNQSYEILLL